METTPPPAEPRKRGRPKGSTKAKVERDRESGAASGTPSKPRGSAGDKRNTAADESYAHWKQLVPVLYDWLASHNLVWPSLSCRYTAYIAFFLHLFVFRVLLRVFALLPGTWFELKNYLDYGCCFVLYCYFV